MIYLRVEELNELASLMVVLNEGVVEADLRLEIKVTDANGDSPGRIGYEQGAHPDYESPPHGYVFYPDPVDG